MSHPKSYAQIKSYIKSLEKTKRNAASSSDSEFMSLSEEKSSSAELVTNGDHNEDGSDWIEYLQNELQCDRNEIFRKLISGNDPKFFEEVTQLSFKRLFSEPLGLVTKSPPPHN